MSSGKGPEFGNGYKVGDAPDKTSMMMAMVSTGYRHYKDVFRYGDPDGLHPKASSQKVHKYVQEGDEAQDSDEEPDYSYSIYNPPNLDPEEGLGKCKAYNLSPFFDLKDYFDLDAYYINVTGYGGNQGWVTLLPEPTEHYMKFPVDFIGDWRCGYQAERHMFNTQRVKTGRFFLSLPNGGFNIRYNGKHLAGDDLNAEIINELAEEHGTFWSVLWNPLNDFEFTIRIKPGNPADDTPSTGRPFHDGFHHHNKGTADTYSYYNFAFLDVMTESDDPSDESKKRKASGSGGGRTKTKLVERHLKL